MAKQKRDFEIGDDGELISDIDELLGYSKRGRQSLTWGQKFAVAWGILVAFSMLLTSGIRVLTGGNPQPTPTLNIIPIVRGITITRTPPIPLAGYCNTISLDGYGKIVYRTHLSNSEIYRFSLSNNLLCTLGEKRVYYEDLQPDWSPNGRFITFVSNRDGNYDLWYMDVYGLNPVNITHDNAYNFSPDWSPDGTQIVFASQQSDERDIYVIDADGGNRHRLTNIKTYSNYPVWSPDGSQIAFTSDRDGQINLFVMDADGANVRRLTDNGIMGRPAWSPDGTKIIYTVLEVGQGQSDLWVVDVVDGSLSQLTNTSEDENHPQWTEDHILYLTHEGIHSMSTNGQDAHLLVALPNVIEFDYIE